MGWRHRVTIAAAGAGVLRRWTGAVAFVWRFDAGLRRLRAASRDLAAIARVL
ncbi:MAG: hypothetical protein ACK58T_02260 [Phycisphaerae bacterium]